MAEGIVAPRTRIAEISPTSMLNVYEHGANGAMGFLPAQKTPLTSRTANLFGDTDGRRYHPAQIPLPATRSLEDHLLTGFVALMLIAYQLRRKHRFLRPHRFGI